MLRKMAGELLAHAWPVWIAQLASIGMMVVDTAVLGHVSALDLAAVAIGGGIHVSVVFALVGILQAVSPLVAQLRGAQREAEIGGILQQGFWLALVLAVPGMAFLQHPGWLLDMAPMAAEVEDKVRSYLWLLSWGLLPALWYRTFYAFCNALGKPRVLMLIGVAALGMHAILAWAFALHGWLGAPLGVAGCATSNVLIACSSCLAGLLYLAFGVLAKPYQPLKNWRRPSWPIWRTLLRIGTPMGLSNLVEITAFTLISLFIAPLGATVVAGHRIVANLAALCYMLPLSLGIATLVAVGHAVGARDWARARLAVRAGMLLAAGLSTACGLLFWLAAEPLVAFYTTDRAVIEIAVGLAIYIALYQFFDALQTIAGHALRACRVTFVPMLIQVICFWGIGLWAGWWLCYRTASPLGVDGFWLASVLSLLLAAVLLGPLLRRTLMLLESSP